MALRNDSKNALTVRPINYCVDMLTDKAPAGVKNTVQILNYLARPFDNIVIIVATPIFELYKHFHGIKKCIQTGRGGEAAARIIFTAITLPLRIIFMTGTIFLCRASLTVIDLAIPYKAIADIVDANDRAQTRLKTLSEEHGRVFSYKKDQFGPFVSTYAVNTSVDPLDVFINALAQQYWM